ncbi:hypothetical protein [Corynebacterium alimapuense]|uniref:VWFA domain-containing protein n=1 Tax=Corynebacterium alimapuense TaxID=1576874 RepID=A0A3M8K8L9_9CORY|nr:hypothetical protein [Corynebacterium alimapuense]RNE49115.1 hypothetical protein C5L39_01620 [Corynebacterium alimapuense]
MGRHANGKQNYSVSSGAVAAIILVIALVAAVVWWFWLRDSTEADNVAAADECIQGELVLPVAESSPGLAEDLIEEWTQSGPVVRDYCVTPEVVDSLSEAAVYLVPDSPNVEDDLAERGASSVSPVAVLPAGLAFADQAVAIDEVDPQAVTYPVASAPDAAIAVAVALAGDQAEELIARDSAVTSDTADVEIIASTEAETPEGFEFAAVEGAELVVSAHVLDPNDSVSEEQTRAAAEFASVNDASEQVPAQLPDRSAGWTAATTTEALPVEETPAEEPEAEPAAAVPSDTLILLDTSNNMNATFNGGSIYEASAQALSQISLDLGAIDQQVALWNYSSPISAGVTEGWRQNVGFSNGTAAANAVQLFGTGGVPQTRSALIAAAANAADKARETGEPARVLLVTSGTEQDIDDATFTARLIQAVGDAPVTIDVVHAGATGTDNLLMESVDSFTTVDTPEQLTEALRSASGL